MSTGKEWDLKVGISAIYYSTLFFIKNNNLGQDLGIWLMGQTPIYWLVQELSDLGLSAIALEI